MLLWVSDLRPRLLAAPRAALPSWEMLLEQALTQCLYNTVTHTALLFHSMNTDHCCYKLLVF